MPTLRRDTDSRNLTSRTILGLRFFLGTASEAVKRAQSGGLVLIPAAPALRNIVSNQAYHDALLQADTLLPDSSFMVLAWNMLEHDHIHRVSGLAYLRELLRLPSFKEQGKTLWILPQAESVVRTREWLASQHIEVPNTHFYTAPVYGAAGDACMDPVLIELIERLRPMHVVIGVGGGVQEPLGADLKRRLDYLPAIHCVGAAIAFLSGEQVKIPVLIDRIYLGWLFRTISNPLRFGKRYWEARKLYSLLKFFRDRDPSLAAHRTMPRTIGVAHS